jgi:hypothetical protein
VLHHAGNLNIKLNAFDYVGVALAQRSLFRFKLTARAPAKDQESPGRERERLMILDGKIIRKPY